MRKKLKNLLFVFMIFFLLMLNINIAIAQGTPDPADPDTPRNLQGATDFLNTTGGQIGYKTDGGAGAYQVILGQIINVFLSLLGIFFLILIIIGGYQWMMAGGNEETITKAKKRITNATIGLAVVLLAYAISYFIMYLLAQETLTPTT